MSQSTTTTRSAGLLTYAYPVGAALIVGALLILALWAPIRDHRPRLPPATPKCYRVREIPIETTKDELLRQLLKCLPGVSATSLQLTLARSSARHRTATFVSSEYPENLAYPVDSHFIGITPLFDSNDAAVDIIAVHGLGSHAIAGFKSKDTNVWLRDFLPKDITARVLVYGYNTAIMDDAKYSITDLGEAFLESYKAYREGTETSRRPIIFIGHSLGGLLIKEALSKALEKKEDSQNEDFFRSSYALVFFGVPNLGVKLGTLNEITDGQMNNQMIRDLELDRESEPTPYLRILNKKFDNCCEKQEPPFKMLAYYEGRMTPTWKVKNGKLTRDGDPCFMVTQESACRIGPKDNDDTARLPANHSDMAKFPAWGDDNYIKVRNRLQTLVKDAPDVTRNRFLSPHRLSAAEQRHWHDLNVPDYKAFKQNTEKLARPSKGTLQWLILDQPSEMRQRPESLRKEDFINWRDSNKPGPLLVIGPPGQGKSVLSNFVVDNLYQSVGELGSNKVIYYFCNIKNDENSRSASAILRALIVQLCEDGRLFRMLPNRFQDKGERQTFHSAHLDELWSTFDYLIKGSPYALIYCVIDGLDVYETDMEDLLNRWKSLMSEEGCRLKLFCTSRPTGPVKSIPISPWRTLRPPDKDLKLFLDEQLRGLPAVYNNDMKEDIREAVLQRSGGTFLWISIILRKLRRLRYPTADIIEDIMEIPKDLDDLYKDLVHAAFREDSHDVAILAWMAYAKTPLRLRELETAVTVSVNSDITSWTDCCKKKLSLNNEMIRKNLGTLVDVIGDRLYFIHQSLRDFLVKPSNSIWRQPDVRLSVLRPELILGKACITFLSLGDFAVTQRDRYKGNDPFLTYASEFWYEHIDKPEEIQEDVGKLQRILREPDRQLWVDTDEIQSESSLYDIAIHYDIGWLAGMLLDQTFSDLSDTFHDDCLVKAAASGPRVLHKLLAHATTHRMRVTDEVMKAGVGNWRNGKETIALLLDQRSPEVNITEDVVIAAASNWRNGKEIIALLLDQHSPEIKITENVVIAAASNWRNGKETIALLLDQRGPEIKITEDVVIAAANNWEISEEIIALLLDQRGPEIKITENVVIAAAKNYGSGKEIIALLLDQRGPEIKITENVVIAAAKNYGSGKEIIALLLDQRSPEIKITEDVIKAAAMNTKEVIALLLDQRGPEIKITEDVIIAAAGNPDYGKEIITLLLDQRGPEIKITEDVVIAAAGNPEDGEEIITLLLDQRVPEINITDGGRRCLEEYRERYVGSR